MYGLIRKSDGFEEARAESTDGYDLSLYDAHELPEGDPAVWQWDVALRDYVQRPPTPAEATAAAIGEDALWLELKEASPAQIEAWLANNLSDPASTSHLLKVLILHAQRQDRTR